MSDRVWIIGRVVVDDDVTSRDGAEGEGLDEFASPFGHRNSDGAACLLQSAQDLDSFVGGDPTANSKRDSFGRRGDCRI